jgi:hypothetical protein
MADLLSTKDLAQQLGVAAGTVRYYRSAGRITPARQTPGGHARWSLEQVRRQLAEPTAAAAAITGLTEEHFAPLGVSDISQRGAGAMPSEMVALGMRESTAPVIDDEQFDAARHRWGGRLAGVRRPHAVA